MKKTLIKILMTTTLLVTGFLLFFVVSNVVVLHAEEHEGHDEIVNGWDYDDSLPQDGGNYYLKKDVTISSTWRPINNTKLCLNGHGIRMTGEGNVIDVKCITNVLSISVYLYDCTDVEHKYTINDDGLAVVDDSLTENYLTFTGGYITGGNGTDHGGGIFLDPGDTDSATPELHTDGITIIGNKTTGKGGGILYNYVSKKNSLIELKNTTIIGNYAAQGGGGICHAANNKYLSLENVTIKDNVSLENAAGILESAQLKIKGKVYVYDNIIKTADGNKEADIFVHNTGQDDRLIVTGELEEGSKIGIYGLRRCRIYDYYKYNEADPNSIFISNTYQALDKANDDVTTLGIPETQYINIDDNNHTIKIAEALSSYEHTIKYGTEEGTYDLDNAPEYKDLGVYTIYYKISVAPIGDVTGKQVITIDKKAPLYPEALTNLEYTGESQILVTVPENAGASYKFKIGNGYWSEYIPKGLDIGEYTIYVRGTGDPDHANVELELKASIITPDKSELQAVVSQTEEYYDTIPNEYKSIAMSLWKEMALARVKIAQERITVAELNEAKETLIAELESAKNDVNQIDDVVALIDAIGDVAFSDESKAKIDAARAAYNALLAAYQKIVNNYESLTNAESTYASLKADSDMANAVIAAIDSIGEVTIDTKAKIDEVRASYEVLSDSQKALVTNLETLTNAESRYAEIKADKDAATVVEDEISAIGDVLFDDESKGRIDAARAEYDALTDSQKALVANYETLTNAESTYANLKNDNETAATVFALINSIGEVSLSDESKGKIDAARAEYDALTDNQKLLVLNLETLTDAESTYAKILVQKQKAEAVDAQIDEIGTLAYNSEYKAKIKAAKAAYIALSAEEKAFVTKYEILTNLEKSYERIDYACRVISLIGKVELSDTSLGEIRNARTAYDALNEEEKGLVTNLEILTNAESEYNNLSHDKNKKFILIVSITGGSFLVLLLVVLYILFFFVFNSWTLVKYKQKRVFKIGRKKGKVKLMRMNFRILYRDEADVYKLKNH